jgi:hypothetical protein
MYLQPESSAAHDQQQQDLPLECKFATLPCPWRHDLKLENEAESSNSTVDENMQNSVTQRELQTAIIETSCLPDQCVRMQMHLTVRSRGLQLGL